MNASATKRSIRSHNSRVLVLGLGLLLCTLVGCVPGTDAILPLRQLVLPPISYAIYSVLVDKYAVRVLNRIQAAEKRVEGITDPLALPEDVATLNPDQLRATVSKRTHLVTDPGHVSSWYRWKITPAATEPNVILEPGRNYTFLYRSNPNMEEANDIASSLWNWKSFGLVHLEQGQMIVHQDGASRSSCRVTIVDLFRLYWIVPVRIAWHGTFDTKRGRKIVWDRTEATFGSKHYENPPVSQMLASKPWNFIKCEDGMVCFQKGKGDTMYLVYDKIEPKE